MKFAETSSKKSGRFLKVLTIHPYDRTIAAFPVQVLWSSLPSTVVDKSIPYHGVQNRILYPGYIDVPGPLKNKGNYNNTINLYRFQ